MRVSERPAMNDLVADTAPWYPRQNRGDRRHHEEYGQASLKNPQPGKCENAAESEAQQAADAGHAESGHHEQLDGEQ